MNIGDKVFELKQEMERLEAERMIKYADKEITRLECELSKIEEEKAEIECQIEIFLHCKQAIRELGLCEKE